MPDLDALVRGHGFDRLSDEELAEIALGNWVQLNAVIRGVDPRTIARLFRLEAEGARRHHILERLYRRLAAVRSRADRTALLTLAATGAGVGRFTALLDEAEVGS